MIGTFVWWFAFAWSVVLMVAGIGVLCTFQKHKRVAECVAAVVVICVGFAVFGVTIGHAIEVCNSQAGVERNGFC